MKTLFKITTLTLAMATVTSAMAHDPALHTKKAEKADCSKMAKMDHSKMDMKDPIMMAMMKKCQKQMEQAKADHTMHHDSETMMKKEENTMPEKKKDQDDETHQHNHNR
jgi:hypothetical protein